MRIRTLFATTLAGSALVACASASTPGTTSTSDEPSQPAWTGNLQPTQQRTGGVQMTGSVKAYGTVRISRAPGALERMKASLTVAVPTTSAQSLRWAVLSGRCGSGDLPLIGHDQFPLLDVSTNGRGQVDAELPLVMTSGGSYHVNVYSGGQQLENVVTCTNLKYNPAR